MADPLLAWNDPNAPKSSLQIYLANGGDPSRAAEFLYASGAQGNTAQERTKDFMRPRTPQELQRQRDAENAWTSHFLSSNAYNPNGANSYAIQNASKSYTQNPISGTFEGNGEKQVPTLATLGQTPTTPTGTNLAETATNDFRNKVRRSDSQAYSGAPQYTQSASLGNQQPYLSGMYQAQNYSPTQNQFTNGTTSSAPSRGLNFSRALWR